MADQKPVVGIIMGSKSDLGVMEGCTAELEALGVPYELVIASAHRTPAKVHEWASTAADRGIKVIIAAAGKAAQSEADAKVAAVIAAGKAAQAAADKREAARKGMEKLLERDENIYFIDPGMDLGDDHEATVDGVHPTDLGFERMLDALTPRIARILRKYGIE